MAEIESVVIVGGGQAGSQAAQSLRKRGYEGAISLICEEAYPPYQRPPLSKAYLKGELDEDRLYFRPASYYDENNIDLRLGARAETIDRGAREVRLSDGAMITYDRLVIATGSRPRTIPLPGADLKGVMTLRGVDDAKALRDAAAGAASAAVIGGGYIGLEAASALRAMGLSVHVFERMPRLLARVTSPIVSDFYRGFHKEKGAEIHCESDITHLVGENGALTGIALSDGTTVPAQIALIGIGVLPNQELAAEAGLDCEDGVVVNESCQTSDPLIYAAGDCCRRTVAGYPGTVRLESVHNALEQGERIAAHIAGQDVPATDTPWFWSDQYNVKLQTVGLFNDYTDTVIRGDQDAAKFSVFYYKGDALVAIDAINDPATFMAGRQIFKFGAPLSKEDAQNADVALKDIVKAHKAKSAGA